MREKFADFTFLKKRYGSHLYFGQFVKFAPHKNNHSIWPANCSN